MKRRNTHRDHGLDYSRDSDGGGSLHGAHMGRGDPDADNYQNFNELLLDWQLQLGIGKPEGMLAFLGCNGKEGLTAKDWQDMALGVAAPNPALIDMLTRIYRDTRGDEMPSATIFANRARIAWNTAREKKTNDDGMEMRVVSVSPELLSPAQHVQPVAAQAGAAPADSSSPAYRPYSPEKTSQSPFYKMLTSRLAELGKGSTVTEEVAVAALARTLGLHPWELQGYKPLGRDRQETIAKLVTTLYDTRALKTEREPDEPLRDIGETADDRARLAFANAADEFFQNKGLDIVGAQRNGHPLSYGGLLGQLMEANGWDAPRMAEQLAAQGCRVPVSTVNAWMHDDYQPHLSMAHFLDNILQLDTQQRQEMASAYELARCKKRVEFKLREAIDKNAGTDQFIPQTLCAAIIAGTDMRPQDLSWHLGLYPSSLQAFASGEIIPSPAIMKHIGNFFGLEHYGDVMEKLTQRHLARQDAKARALAGSLGSATGESPLADIIHTAFAAEGPFAEALKPVGSGHLQNIIDGYRTHASHSKIEALCDGLELKPGSHARHLMSEICHKGSHKPFGMMLSDYVAGGGKSLAGFLRQFMSANEGWNLDITELAGMVGLSEAGLREILKKDHIDKGDVIQKFVERFDLSPRKEVIGWHEQLLWYLARGDKSLPEPDQLVADAQKALLSGTAPREVAQKLAIALWDRIGLTREKMQSLLGGQSSLLVRLRSEAGADLPDIPTPRIMDRLAQILVAHNPRLMQAASDLFLGIAAEQSATQLLDQAREGKITIHQLLKTVRKQRRMYQEEFANHASKFLAPGETPIGQHNITEWESGTLIQGKHAARIEALASMIGYESAEDRADFAALARGMYVRKENRKTPAQLLDEARDGAISFGEVITGVRVLRGHERTEAAAKATAFLPVGSAPIKNTNMGYWENTHKPVRNEAWAGALASYLGYEGDDRKDFITLALGRPFIRKENRKTRQDYLAAIRAGSSMTDLIDTLLKEEGKNFPQLARDMGVSVPSLRRWHDGEYFIRFEKDALAFARYLNITEPLEVQEFITFAMGKTPDQLLDSQKEKPVLGNHTALVVSHSARPEGYEDGPGNGENARPLP
jgi:hypothetical protein